METIQAVKIRLSNGLVGLYYGFPLPGSDDPEVSVVDVEFEQPRVVAGISAVSKNDVQEAENMPP